jgi:hypothetical protein
METTETVKLAKETWTEIVDFLEILARVSG